MRRLLAALVLAGCGSGGAGTPDGAVTGAPDAGPYSYRTCPLGSRVGDFKIQLEESFTAISGVVRSAVAAGDVPVVAAEAGDCRVLARKNLFCDPPCSGDLTCGDDRKCVPAPVGRSAGTIAISGLSAPVTMMPGAIGQHYDYTKLPHPGFQPGAEVVLWAAGAQEAGFLLQGRGVAPVQLMADKPMLVPGQDFQLAWTPGAAGPARVALQIEIDQHGMSHASLACDVPDTGSATIGAALIDQLIKLGTSGFPKVTVTRRTVDATMSTSGCVELQVLTAVERPLTVMGHTPCRSTTDCPMGQTCATDVQTCR